MAHQVIIASQNNVKIKATELGFKTLYPGVQFEFIGASVPSGVKDQPLSDEETLTGAMNRVINAQVSFPQAHCWVGIEGGLASREEEMESFAWVIVKTKSHIGKAKTNTFFLPKKIVQLIKEGCELSTACDMIFKSKDSKHTGGSIGVLTNNLMNVTNFYRDAVILALLPHKRSDLYH